MTIDPNADPWSRTPAEDVLVQIAGLHRKFVACCERCCDTCGTCMTPWPCDTRVLLDQVVPR